MSRDAEDKEEGDRRTLVNLLGAIVVLLLVIAGFWLINFLDERRKLEACLEVGRRDCGQDFAPSN